MNHRQVYISLVFVWLVGPVEKFCLNWFASGVIDGTCYVCTYSSATQNTMTTDFFIKIIREILLFAVKIFPSRQIGVFAAVTNHFFQFMLPLVVLLFIYAHIAVVLFKKSRKNTLTEVLHFLFQQILQGFISTSERYFASGHEEKECY